MNWSRSIVAGRFVTVILVGFCSTVLADGMLTVRTEPEGIEVWLDDKFVGDSPVIDKKLKPGRYSLKLVDPVQHSSTVEEVFIQDNETTVIEKTVKAKFGSLRVTSDPEGAQVFISTELGKSPIANDFMNPGKYRVEIRHPSKRYKPAIEDVVIPRGEMVNVSKTLKQEKALDGKAIARLALGAGTAGGFIWAMVAHGDKRSFDARADLSRDDPTREESLRDKAGDAAVGRAFGIIIGSLSLIGLEIVAFF